MSTVPCEKDHLAPDQVIVMEDGSSQADTENFGTIFDVTFVPPRMSASPTEPVDGKETSLTQETVRVRKEMKILGRGGLYCMRKLMIKTLGGPGDRERGT